MNRVRGFSLIELVAVIVLLSVAGTAIVGMYGSVASSLGENQDIQTGVQLTQECGEYLLNARRNNAAIGYTNATGSTFCSAILPAFPGYTVSIAFTDPYAGAACPGTCKLAQITASKGTDTVATTTLMLVSY